MLRQRVATALVLAPLAILMVAYLPPPLIWYPLAPIFGAAGWEWARLSRLRAPLSTTLFGLVVALAVAFGLPLVPATAAIPVCAVGVLVWLVIAASLPTATVDRGPTRADRAVKLVIGLLVLLIAAFALGTIFNGVNGRGWLLALLLVVWGADTGAYFTGKRFGKRKLAPAISPGKTWEGVYGGLAAAGIVCAVAAHLAGLSPGQSAGLVLVGVLCAAISIVGDLFASLLKRRAGLKDSSRLLPGHGGVIDRCDSLIAAAPALLLGLALLGISL